MREKILEEGQLRKENYREDLDVLADEGGRERGKFRVRHPAKDMYCYVHSGYALSMT